MMISAGGAGRRLRLGIISSTITKDGRMNSESFESSWAGRQGNADMQISELFSTEIYDQAVMYFFAVTGWGSSHAAEQSRV